MAQVNPQAMDPGYFVDVEASTLSTGGVLSAGTELGYPFVTIEGVLVTMSGEPVVITFSE